MEKFFIKDGIGVDEVGRGALAGPLVVAAIIFDPDVEECYLKEIGVDDSKKLSEKRRYSVNEKLMLMHSGNLMQYGLGVVQPADIDKLGITQSIRIAANDAIQNLTGEKIFIDGTQNPFDSSKNVTTIVKGDAKCYNIGAASIVAKVWRDDVMKKLSSVENACYNWGINKGYGTSEHIRAILANGLSTSHRLSFCKKLVK